MDHLLDDIEGDRHRHGWKAALRIQLRQHKIIELESPIRRRSPGYYVARIDAVSSQDDLRGRVRWNSISYPRSDET